MPLSSVYEPAMAWTWRRPASSRASTITLTAFHPGAGRPASAYSGSSPLVGRTGGSQPLHVAVRRYALDVNIDSLDVLNHKRLLDSSRAEPNAVSFQVRPVDVVSGTGIAARLSSGSLLELRGQSLEAVASPISPPAPSPFRPISRPLPRPAFGSSPNLQVGLVVEGSVGRWTEEVNCSGLGGIGG